MSFRQIALLVAAALPAMALAGSDSYFTGDGTSYTLGQVSAGNCNFMYDPGVGDNYAALNSAQWDSTLNCGRCAEVSCADSRCSDTSSSVTVYIVDKCPECSQGDLDLSPTVFKQLTGSDPSVYSIKWKFVDCPTTGNIQYCADSLTNTSRIAVQPANVAEEVASVKIANQDAALADLGGYFFQIKGTNFDLKAVDIEMTSVSGKTVKDKVALVPGKCTEGTAKFAAPTRALTENFNDLNTGKANNYKAGTVNAADESSKTGVSILQSNDAAVDKNPMEANTKSEEEPSSSKGTSPGVVTLVVLAAVGCVALAVVAISAKKKKMKEKSIDDLARPFGTFSSPVRINSTIAKI